MWAQLRSHVLSRPSTRGSSAPPLAQAAHHLQASSPLAHPPPPHPQGELEKEAKEKGVNLADYAKSMVVQTSAPKALGTLRAADGKEGFDAGAQAAAGATVAAA